MTPEQIAAIAGKLTKAQREALVKKPWSMMAQYEAGILELLFLGLLDPDGLGHRLSALGLAVRGYLEKEAGL